MKVCMTLGASFNAQWAGGRPPCPLTPQMSTIIRRYMTDTNVGPNYMDDQNYLSAPLISV